MDWHILSELWIFGDRRSVPLLQNEAIDLLNKKVVEFWLIPSCELVFVYPRTAPGAVLRTYLIDLFAKLGSPDLAWCRARQRELSIEALHDLIGAIWKAKQPIWTQADLKALKCRYHVHEEGVQCHSGEGEEQAGVQKEGDK